MSQPTTVTFDSIVPTPSLDDTDSQLPVPSTTLIPSSINSPISPASVLSLETSLATAPPESTTLSSSTISSATSVSTTAFTQTPTSSTALATSSATSSALPASKPILTKAGIAGVTVAGVASAALVFGLLFLVCCLRRKRAEKRNSGSSFGGDRIIESDENAPEPDGPVAGNVGQGDQTGDQACLSGQRLFVPGQDSNSRWSFWRRSITPEQIGVAVAPYSMQNSPMSASSYRTTSQLLPDKPSYTLVPSPLRIKPYANPENGVSRFADITIARRNDKALPAKPAPRGRNSLDTSQTPIQHRMIAPRPPSLDPFVNTQDDPRAMMYARERKRASPSMLPRIVPPGPSVLHSGQWTTSPDVLRKPVPARQPVNLAPPQVWNQPMAQFQTTTNSSNPASRVGRPSYTQINPPKTASGQVHDFVPIRKSLGKRPQTQYSAASETSFEEEGDDAETMPEPRLALSPVVESPPSARPPLGGVRYPRVPESATSFADRCLAPESPTRKPPRRGQMEPLISRSNDRGRLPVDLYDMPELPDQTSSLLAKRRGEEKARSLEKGLRERQHNNQAIMPSAKWKILVGPGLDGIENTSSPHAADSSVAR
ncbi:hypothetical protein MMC12_001210 [Toensbergia leucococca]|nr:hypothetical protein [Toensbergia leucococca]